MLFTQNVTLILYSISYVTLLFFVTFGFCCYRGYAFYKHIFTFVAWFCVFCYFFIYFGAFWNDLYYLRRCYLNADGRCIMTKYNNNTFLREMAPCSNDKVHRKIIYCLNRQKGGAPPPRPTHGTLYVAKTYPPWQHAVLTTLKKLYDVSIQDRCIQILALSTVGSSL